MCPTIRHILVARESKNNVNEIEKENSTLNLTVLFTFSASGLMEPPMVVYTCTSLSSPARRLVPDTWRIGVTPNCWIKTDLYIDYRRYIVHPY